MSQRHTIIAKKVASLCKDNTSARVIDCGCGKAHTIKLLYRYGFCNVVGYDIDPNRGLRALGNLNRVKFGSILDLPEIDETADITICSEVLEHLNSKECSKALKELNRITQPGGYVIITTPENERDIKRNPKHVRLVSFKELKNFFDEFELIENSIGYKNKKCRERGRGTLFVVFRKPKSNAHG